MIDLGLEAKTLYAICNYRDCLDIGVVTIQPEYFADKIHRRIFEVIKSMYAAEQPVSIVTVYEAVKPFIGIGTNNKWMWVTESFCSGSEFKYLTGKLKDIYKARQLYYLTEEIRRQVDDGADVSEILKMAMDRTQTIAADTEDVVLISPQEHAARILDTIGKRVEKKTSGGIYTSFYKLNKVVNGGFQPGELVILSAKTGRGKTAFAMNLSQDIAIVQKIPTCYINTEMNEDQIDIRLASIVTHDYPDITYEKMATGNLTDMELSWIAASLDRMHSSQFYSIDKPDLTMDAVQSIANRTKMQKGIKVLILDYVGRIDTSDPKLKEYQVLVGIAKRLKTLAQTLKIVVIMLAQLNDDDKLANSRAMENECDLMLALEEMDEDEELEYGKKYNYFLVIRKNRNGPRGKIPLKFIGEKMLFRGEAQGENARIGTVEKKSPYRSKRKKEW